MTRRRLPWTAAIAPALTALALLACAACADNSSEEIALPQAEPGAWVAGDRPGDPPRYVPPAKKVVLPADLPDPANPPQGTRTVVDPGPPTPPDPSAKPSLVVDPERGR